MSLDAFVGVLIGSGISIIVAYLNHRWTEKRESQKIEIERQNEAISQIYSPLVFILHKARDAFVVIAAFQKTLQETSNIEEIPKDMVRGLSYFPAVKARTYSQALEDMLIHKSGLIEPNQFYFDLSILQSYLSTLFDQFNILASKSDIELYKLKQYFSELAPIIIQLDEAISQMRNFAMAQTARLQKYEYNLFFTEKKYLELEGYLNKAHIILTGGNIPEWSLVLSGLREDAGNTRKEEQKKN